MCAAGLTGPSVMKAFSGEGLKIVERLRLTQEGLEMEYQVGCPYTQHLQLGFESIKVC